MKVRYLILWSEIARTFDLLNCDFSEIKLITKLEAGLFLIGVQVKEIC